MSLSFDSFSREYRITLRNALSHTVSLGADVHGNITRIDNVLDSFESKLKACEERLENIKNQLESAKVEVQKPFAHELELKEKSARLDELNIMLNMDKNGTVILGEERSENNMVEPEKAYAHER